MKAYIIQEFSNLDGEWHNVVLSSSINGIYVDENKARAVYKLFQDASTNLNHLRLITCGLTLVKAECGSQVANFEKEFAYK